MGETGTFRGDPIGVGGVDQRVAIAAELGAEIVAQDPQNIRPIVPILGT